MVRPRPWHAWRPMNATACTTHCTTTSAEDRDGSAVSSLSDSDNPPEPDDPPASTAGSASAPDHCEPVVEVNCAVEVSRTVDLPWLRERLMAALVHISRPARRITVTLIGDAEMRALNRTYRKVDDTSDVLSFDTSVGDEAIDADIVVCVDVAAHLAGRLGHSVEQELLLYALHGVLHCAGFDDETAQGFEAIHLEEDRILTVIGVGSTFARGSSDHDGDRATRVVMRDCTVD